VETAQIEGLRVAFERTGRGPPVVLLHGYVGDGATTWRRQLEGLANDFTIVAWDAPGAGRSADPPETFGMAGYADCLAAFVAELGLDRPHLVGLSFGGALAIELSRRHPAIARTLVLASAYAGWSGSLPPGVAERRLRQAEALSELTGDEFVQSLLPTMFSDTVSRETIVEFRESMLRFHPSGFRAMARASAEDLRDALPHIEVPTLLIHGDNDARAPLAVARHLHGAIRGSTLVVLAGVGHICNVEAADRFNATVRRFLRGQLITA
jgi:pimeloyl-ACP methyl ester carboxylesterase